MPAGFKYDMNPIEKVMPEMCRFETVYRLSGGFNLDISNLAGVDAIPPLTPVVIDFVTRKAVAVINVEVAEAITAGATALKVKKGSLVQKGNHLGNGSNGGTVVSVDKSNADYDLVTLAEGSTLAADKGVVLFEATAAGGKTVKASANFLNYAWTKVVEGATITAIGRAYEIRPSRLLAPISEKDKATLGDRFLFTY